MNLAFHQDFLANIHRNVFDMCTDCSLLYSSRFFECNFHNYTVITKILFMKYSSQLVILDTSYRHKVSLASNNEFTGVFQAIVSVLHSLHHLHNVAIALLL